MNNSNFLDHFFFSNNRKKLANALGKDSVAIVAANKVFNELPFRFIQNKNLFYLTGIEQEGTLLLVDGDSRKEILFLQNPNVDKVWNGERLTERQAKEISGIDEVFFYDVCENLNLKKYYESYTNVYTNFSDPLTFLNPESINIPCKDLNDLMSVLRMKKENCEIECIRRAGMITKKGLEEVRHILKPGIKEYEIEGILLGSFIRYGARYSSFASIVASGKNACTLHYTKNLSQCENGDLVLLDVGAEFCNYCSDVTRVMAVGGKFTRRQEKIYNAVLRISQFAKSVVKVGITFKELQMMTGEKMKEELSVLGLLKGSELKGDEYKKYFMHGVSHSLGLDVHDLCDRKLPFCENMVITIEPGIYVQDEGVGVRIEDDVVVKGGCCEVLTEGISLGI